MIPLTKDRILQLCEDKEIYSISGKKIEGLSQKEKIEQVLEKEKALKILQDGESILLQTSEKCYACDRIMFHLTPQTFSYLNPDARCPVCFGRGIVEKEDLTKIIPDPTKSLLNGAIPFYGKLSDFIDNPSANWMKGEIVALALKKKIDLNTPWCDLPQEFKNQVLHGTDFEVTFTYHNKKNGRTGEITRKVEGLVNIVERCSNNDEARSKFFSKEECPTCHGERLSREGRMVMLLNKRYPEVSKMTFDELILFCEELRKKTNTCQSAINSMEDICFAARDLGISYLPLNATTNEISSGESQRIKLLGAYLNHLSHILYIFDEPSKGLDKKDYESLKKMFHHLIENDNTILMVEHNLDMISMADHVIEMGPKAGNAGGKIIAEGSLEDVTSNPATELSKYQKMNWIAPSNKLDEFVYLEHLNKNNLKDISISFPKHALTSIIGVSGSGKSSLMLKEIYPRMLDEKGKKNGFQDCILVDSSPIGKNSKSIVATYLGIMDRIRELFAKTEEAKTHHFDEKFFSFNQDGACSTCHGDGRIEEKFSEDSYQTCPTCFGKRYQEEVLEINYQNKNIFEVLNLSIEEAISFFDGDELSDKLQLLKKIGLGYLQLGRMTSTLSGGEATRLKLAKEQMKGKKEDTLFLFDEPTTGLHFSDVENLLKLMKELTIHNTVVAIEHNEPFIQSSDYLIELGPGPRNLGGRVLYQGRNNLKKKENI
jgi:excinuclease ABC subunit A